MNPFPGMIRYDSLMLFVFAQPDRQVAMVPITIRKLLCRSNNSSIVEEIISSLQAQIGIYEQDGTIVLGNHANDPSSGVAITIDDEPIGRVVGGKEAGPVAKLLSHLAQKEFELKSMARETLEKYKEITLLYNFAEKISARHTAEQISGYAIKELMRIVRADTVYVALLNEQTGAIEILDSSDTEYIGNTVAGSLGVIARDILQKGNAEIINDVPSDPRALPGENKVRSMICAPLKAQDKVTGVAIAFTAAPFSYSSGDLKLFIAITSQTAVAIENARYIRELVEATAARERFESELKVAKNIQMSMIPRKFPAFPDNTEFSIFAFMKPAQQVGGDFYDFFFIDENHIFFTIGDVSGKGIPAALTMANFVTLIKVLAHEEKTPDDLLLRINREFSRINDYLMFVTLFCGILDTRSGETVYANGGHCHPLIIGPGKKLTQMAGADGPAVGFDEDSRFIRNAIAIQPGDSIIAYTDGVIEANDRNSKLFTTQRLISEVEGLGTMEVEKIVSTIYEQVEAFSDGMPQSDDITILVIRYHGPGGQ